MKYSSFLNICILSIISVIIVILLYSSTTEGFSDSGYCNFNNCDGGKQGGTYCNKNSEQCKGCSGKWCTSTTHTPKTTPLGYCNWTDCNGQVQGGTWCNQGQDKCKGCGGKWCAGKASNGQPNGQTTPPNGQTTPPNGQTTPPNGQTTQPNGQTTPPVHKPPKHSNGDWKDIVLTHYYDCGGQSCDAPLLQPFDASKFLAGPGYTVLDPKDHGGSVYGEKMWIYGAASDSLAEIMGANIDGLGHTDSSSGPNFGCGRCILIKNSDSKNPDWTALVMRKSQCPGDGNPQCARPNIHIDLMIPGFDFLGASVSNQCDKPGTGKMTKALASICGSGAVADCNCENLPGPYVAGCNLFKAWGWNTGDPGWNNSTQAPMSPSPAQYKIVTTPPAFIEYTKKIQLGGVDATTGIEGFLS